MTTKQIAKTAIRIDPSVREFFKKINFHPIPEEAKYIAFLEDGESCFLEDIETSGYTPLKFLFVTTTYIENVEVELPD